MLDPTSKVGLGMSRALPGDLDVPIDDTSALPQMLQKEWFIVDMVGAGNFGMVLLQKPSPVRIDPATKKAKGSKRTTKS
jgi:hypothetical protein